jgi:hypothetical protein
MVAYGARMHRERIDTAFIGRYWLDRTETMLRACVRDLALLPPGRSMHVLFHDYMADDMAVVEKIYALAGQPLFESSRAAMAAYMEEHGRGRFGRIDYKLSDFSLHADEIRERTRFYLDAFGIREETTAL